VRHGYRIGVPSGGQWLEVLNSDAEFYAGSNVGNAGGVIADDFSSHGQPHTLTLNLPPLGVLILRPE
jgi:1,4-alpha-glucan branching enzyme